MQRPGFNWIRVWANWQAFGADAPPRMETLVIECDRRGMVVDVTFSRGNGVTGPPRLQTLEAHRGGILLGGSAGRWSEASVAGHGTHNQSNTGCVVNNHAG